MQTSKEHLERGLGLKEATALNMIDMVGIGPFVVMPLVVKSMGGPQALIAWIAGAMLAFIDGFVWAELGAAMPQAGGSYVFLREAFGNQRWGRMMSFLFIWQTMFQAPLVIASGAIGFNQYLTYLLPLNDIGQKAVSGLLVILLVVLLYRRITSIGKLSLFLWAGVMITFAMLIWGGVTHFQSALVFSHSDWKFDFNFLFFASLGQATVQTIYTYLGYYNVCHLGGEIRDPEHVIPKSIFISIGGIAVLYLAIQLSVLGTLPSAEIASSKFVVSTFVEHLYGKSAASIATAFILWIAFASLFSALLGYSRVPYAAALDGTFFSQFARLHPIKRFPHISLLWLGGVAFVFSLLFRLADVIKSILAMRILIQFIGQTVGVILLRRRRSSREIPFKMWGYPVPAILGSILWASVFISTGREFAVAGLLVIATGILVFLIRARKTRTWPWTNPVGNFSERA